MRGGPVITGTRGRELVRNPMHQIVRDDRDAIRLLARERDREHDLDTGTPCPLDGEPEVGEPTVPSEGDLRLRRAHLERTEVLEHRAHATVDVVGHGVAGEEALGIARWLGGHGDGQRSADAGR